MASHLVPCAALNLVTRALHRSPVVAIVGPRQCGKTTLARQLVSAGSPNYFDLRLDALWVVYPGDVRYAIDDRITALPASARFPALETGVAATA